MVLHSWVFKGHEQFATRQMLSLGVMGLFLTGVPCYPLGSVVLAHGKVSQANICPRSVALQWSVAAKLPRAQTPGVVTLPSHKGGVLRGPAAILSYRAILSAIVSQNVFVLVFLGYRTSLVARAIRNAIRANRFARIIRN